MCSTNALAFPINIAPGAYVGTYNPAGKGLVTGPLTVDLNPGTYNVVIAPGSGFTFVVDVNGNVTTVSPAAAAQGNQNTLTFATTTVAVNPGFYTGTYSIAGVNNTSASGQRSFILMPGLDYILGIAPSNAFLFHVDENGDVTTVTPATAAQGNGNTLTFTTTTVVVNPGAYTGTYNVAGVNNTSASGQRSFVLMRGLRDYILGIAPGNDFRFTVGGDGNITTVNPATAAQGNGSTLTFTTTTVLVNPGAYSGTYSIRGVNSTPASGQRSFILMPGLADYILDIAPGNDFRFRVDGIGAVRTTTSAAVGQGNTLAFNTTTIAVAPRNYVGTYSIRGVNQALAAGLRHFILLPGVSGYILDIAPNVNSRFNVASPCAVIPTALMVGIFTFDITCGRPDADGDGVPDDTDNCQSLVNPDQLDQDLDEVGNVCDPDLDGDGVDNAADNCPDFANADQADSDGDGTGDACEADDDNDGVADELDSCPLISNPDQANSDGDSEGDACDADDDNDGIVDQFDNCPCRRERHLHPHRVART